MAHVAGMLAILLPVKKSGVVVPHALSAVGRPANDEIVSAPPWPQLDRHNTTPVSPYHRLSLPC